MSVLVVVGDALLDRDIDGSVERLCPDAPAPVVDDPLVRSRPGGAGLAAALAAQDGRTVVLVTALGADPAGDELRALLAGAGVTVLDVGLDGETPQKVRVRAGGQPLVRIDHGGRRGSPRSPDREALAAVGEAAAVLVSDYGRGLTSDAALRAALADACRRMPVVWDPHPRGAEPVAGVRLATPNRMEAVGLTPEVEGDGLHSTTSRARALLARWQARAVAVTLGAGGALLVDGAGPPMAVPPPTVASGDPCGAGDRFAATVTTALLDGAYPSEAVAAAVASASAFVAAGGAGALIRPAGEDGARTRAAARASHEAHDEAARLAAQVRDAGGTVVATGGCFDLLHAGHVAMLQAARRLGDCLIVCLNSDASVRRLKGPDRPFVPQADRAALLLALGCVDAVAVFDEPTPEGVLERLRPDVFAKGGDYGGADLPEARTFARWGGQAVILPYLEGRSTTRLMQEVLAHDRR